MYVATLGMFSASCGYASSVLTSLLNVIVFLRFALTAMKVAACVRTKDFGRFLPEWIAYHYAIGVDEITIYDDDSIDDTVEIIQPFVDAGIVHYVLERTGQ